MITTDQFTASKEKFYDFIQKMRNALDDSENIKCTCPKIKCEFHGDCAKCVAIHRYNGEHIPNCLQFIISDKIKALAGACEMIVSEKEKTPPEYWDYVREMDKNKEN